MIEMIEKLRKNIDEGELIQIIKDMVSIPSCSGIEGQETDVAKYIHEFFQKEGIESEIIPVVNGRSNVVARLKGSGNGKTLLLTGHTDTVPPYDMKDAFNARIDDGKLIGRGTVDMKGPLACMMLALAGLKRAEIPLKGDVVFAGVIDEEEKSEGTIHLLQSGITADLAIVGEPSEMNICVAHRGLEWFEIFFQGKTVHGGKQKEGINAIMMASRFIQRVEEKLLPLIESRIHPVIGTSSMNYGYIHGGLQPSTVAGECTLQIDRRWVPGEKYSDIIKEYSQILEELHQGDPKFNAQLKVMDVSVMAEGYIHEAMEIDLKNPAIDVISKAIEAAAGRIPEKLPFTAWSDGGLLSSYGKIPTVILGPGNLESAHSPEEYIEISQLIPAALTYAVIAYRLCGEEK